MTCPGPNGVHEYDDDWPFHDADLRHLAPGSRPGDPCVWCPEEKPQAAPPLSFAERQTVRRFDEAPDPWCRLCDGVGEVQARLPHVLTWDRLPCPECMPAVER